MPPTASALLTDLDGRGVHLYLGDGQLRAIAAKNAMTGEVRELIRAHRGALIALLSDRDSARSTPIPSAGRGRPLPLSFAQQRLWFLAQLDPDSVEYNSQTTIGLTGTVDAAALAAALSALVARHEVLRTRLVADAEGVPWQVVDPPAPIDLPVVELAEDAVGAWLTADARTPFDLAAGPLFRATLLRIAPDEHVLAIAKHHVVSDEWSTPILRRELEALYAAAQQAADPGLPPLPVQYADFAVWQRGWLSGEVLGGQVAYWRNRLAAAPALELPLNRPRPALRSADGALIHFRMPPAVAEGLRTVARESGASMFMTLYAAFAALLTRWTGQEDIVVGTPVANRNRAELEGLIGFFVNTLVLRTDLSGDPTFTELLGRVRSDALAAFAHQDVPFEQLVDELAVARDRSRTPLFQALFNYVTDDGADAPDEPPHEGVLHGAAPFDLTLSIGERNGGLAGGVEFATALFDEPTIRRLIGHLSVLLEAVATNPATRLSALPLLTDPESRQVQDWSDGGPVPPPSGGVHDVIAAAANPTAVAVAAGGVSLSYAELFAQADRLAAELRGRGVGAGSVVGLALPRTVDLIVAVLAVWRAGAAYLALDPAYPAERLEFMTADSGVSVTIGPDGITGEGTVDGRRAGLAAVVYTSGSTGRPKASLVPHAALLSIFAGWSQAHFPGVHGMRWLSLASASFDVFTGDVVRALCSGGTLVLGEPGAQLDPAVFASTLDGVEALECAPRYVDALVDYLERSGTSLPSLRLLVVTTDVWRLSAAARARRALGDARVLTAYGVTEATIDSTFCDVSALDGDGPAPIGSPLPGTSLHLLDRWLNPVPAGVVGQLFLGGSGLTRGYGGCPDLTAERFVADPFAGDGSRLYRTGDLGRWRPDGQVEFLGRADVQVKVRGFRVEPGEIEYALTAHPEVSAAVVVADGQDRLVAYVVPAGVAGLREMLRERLPEFMVPSVFVGLDALPLSPNGKIDRSALPAPDGVRPELDFVAPRTTTEELLAGVWAQLLGVDRVGVFDDFFSLGGHSLLATQVVSRIRVVFGVEVPVAAIFDAPTVAGLAALVDVATPGMVAPSVVSAGRDGALPLSFAQQRLWFLAQLEPGSVEYNTPILIGLTGPLDVAALAAALGGLVARHEVLRTRLVADVDGVPWQVIDPPAPFDLPVVDLSTARSSGVSGRRDPDAAVDEWVAADLAVPFDLASGPLFRASLLRLADDEHLIAIAMHHVVADEWSEGILRRELEALYAAERAAAEAGLPALPVQYADFAVWQRAWLSGETLENHLAYWRARLADAPVLELPTDRPRPPVRSSDGAMIDFAIPDAVIDRLRTLSRASGASMFMTTFAAYALLLSRYSGQDDIVVGTPIANRNRAEIEGLIGYFVNTLVLRTDLSDDPTFGELLARVRAEALSAFAHQDVPFERLVDELVQDRDRSRTPLFQALFNYFTADDLAPAGIDDASDTIGRPRRALAKFDLRLIVKERGPGLVGAVHYATQLFDEATIRRLIAHFLELLTAITEDAHLSELLLSAGSWHEAPALPLPSVTGVDALIAYPDPRVNQLANYLRSVGVGPESVVGLAVERGDDFVQAVLAVWRAGGAYVALDPSLPVQRSRFQLAEAGVSVLVGSAELIGDLPVGRLRTVLLDDPMIGVMPESPPQVPGLALDRVAYVMFTSGSTGRPKAAQVTHRGLLNYVTTMPDRLGIGAPGTTYALLQPPTTDFGNTVLFTALTTGGRLLYLDPDDVAGHGADYMKIVPSHLASLLEAAPLEELLPSRTLVLGGEATPIGLARSLVDAAGDRVIANHYGPTETTIGVATVRLSDAVLDDVVVPIGAPLPNVRLYVLDRSLREVPAGVHGELYVGGAALARGYRGRPELTAERFVADPFTPGGRLYRTGDVVKRRPDGLISFLGRADDQVKVRGYRIEPAEIQAALLSHPAVNGAVIVADNGRLIAYLVAEDGIPSTTQLRGFLGERLPEFMIPAVFVELAAIPLTGNGKVDRSALPAPDQSRPELEDAFVAPQTPTQEVLAGIWGDVLGVDRVGVHDNFFELGGHSLLATQVISRIRAAFGVELPVAALFDAPSVAGVAEAVEAAAPGLVVPSIVAVDRGRKLPLSFAQQRLWFLAQLEPESAEYNTSTSVRLSGALDVAALAAALDALVGRHEVLRTRLVAGEDGVPHQVVDALTFFRLPVIDLSGRDDPLAAARAWLSDDLTVPFDLAAGPPFRATLLRLAPDDHVLVLSMHHIVSDEWSLTIMHRELDALYAAAREGVPAGLPPLPVQYADYATWQRQWLSGEVLETQLQYWLNRLADAPVLELPTDRPRPPVRSSAGAMIDFEIPADVVERLRALSRKSGASMFMTMFALYTMLLSRYSGQDDIVVGTPIANRNRAEVEGLIGYFVNTLVLRADLSGDPTFGELLARVRAETLQAFAHQDVPFERLVDELVHDRDRSRSPLFQVLFNYFAGQDGRAPSGEVQDLPAKFDLRLIVAEDGPGLIGAVHYATRLFDEATIRRLIAHFLELLAEITEHAHLSQLALSAGSWHEAPPVELPAVSGVDALIDYPDPRVNQLANYLRSVGVGPESVVGLAVESGEDFVRAVLAVWRAGGAYVTLDPSLPVQRSKFQLA
ncbi:amino acid adenylation domain-containing protein, partial [Dactylosporangium sp. NPDC051541]|uniref:amino acid adenylation domain-containing protein n=1 Tax=Dactylosporangium sp. NPDC051541 TaxID=3363977 RepID=UPI0037923CB9